MFVEFLQRRVKSSVVMVVVGDGGGGGGGGGGRRGSGKVGALATVTPYLFHLNHQSNYVLSPTASSP